MGYAGYENKDAKEIHVTLASLRRMKWNPERPEMNRFLEATAERREEEWVVLTPEKVRMM